MEKTIKIGGVEVPMKANAATPRYYLERFGRDIFDDMAKIRSGDTNLAFMENLAYLMAWQVDRTIPESVVEWLEQFDDPMGVLNASKDIMTLWYGNAKTRAKAKKKDGESNGE